MAESTNPVLAQAEKGQQAIQIKTVPGETVTSSSKTSSRVTTVAPIASPVGETLDSALSAINAGIAEMAKFTSQAIDIEKSAASVAEAAATAVANVAGADQTITAASNAAELKKQLDVKAVYDAMGGTAELVKLAEGLRVAQTDQLAKQEAVRANVDVDFTENPTQWLVNKLTVGALDEEASVASATVRKYQNAIANITSLASSTDQAITAAKVTVTEATLAAEQEKIAQVATINAAQYRLHAAKSNANEVALAMSASKDQVNSIVDKYKLQLAARSEENALAERELRRQAMEKDGNRDVTFVNGVLAGREWTGVPIYKGTDINLLKEQSDKILVERDLGGDSQEKVINQFEKGIGVVAPTPFETFEAYYVSDETKLTDGSNKALEALNETRLEVIAAANTAGVKLTKDNMPTMMNDAYKAKMDGYARQIKSTDESNPNRAAPLTILVAANSVKSEPLVATVFAHLIAGGVKDLTPEQVIEYSAAAIKTKRNPEGKVRLEAAVEGITTIYKQAIVYNNKTQDRERRGLPLQTDYKAKLAGRLAGNSLINQKLAINLADPVEVRAALLKMTSPYAAIPSDIRLFDIK